MMMSMERPWGSIDLGCPQVARSGGSLRRAIASAIRGRPDMRRGLARRPSRCCQIRLVGRFENIGRDQDDSGLAVLALPMNGLTGFPGGVARMKSLRAAIVTDHRDGSLHEINHAWPASVAMDPRC